MRRPRLCFVGWGDHVHLERWAGYFARGDFEVAVLSLSGLGRYPPTVRQWQFPFGGRGPTWLTLWLRYMLWRLAPDLVHVHWAHFAAAVHPVWRGPLAVTAWGSDIYRRDQFSDAEWRATGRALKRADLVTCDSQDLAATIRSAFELAPETIEVIQWGVDTDLFAPEGPDLRSTLGLAGREVVLSARNFTPIYNQETVVKAFATLRHRRPGAFLLMKDFCGDVRYREGIAALIREHGLGADVRIVETVPYEEMPALYRTADVTVSIPLSDAAPMALFEAMACGSAAVVCDLPSLREWVTHERTGLLVKATDAAAVTAALEQLLEATDARDRICRAARALVVGHASQHAHMGRMAGHYSGLVGAKPMPVH